MHIYYIQVLIQRADSTFYNPHLPQHVDDMVLCHVILCFIRVHLLVRSFMLYFVPVF